MHQSEGEGDQGEGEGDQGEGEGDQGEDEGDQGEGEGDQGDGDQGEGEGDQGEGEGDQGEGEGDQGEGGCSSLVYVVQWHCAHPQHQDGERMWVWLVCKWTNQIAHILQVSTRHTTTTTINSNTLDMLHRK